MSTGSRLKQKKVAPANTDELASKARLRVWLGLLKTSRMIESEIRDKLRVSHRSTLPRFDVMAALYREKNGLRMSQLSDALKVSNGNVTGIVDRLVAGGQIMRVPVEGDRRAKVVRLTQRGREEFSDLASDHEEWVDKLLADVPADYAAQMIAQLKKIRMRLEKMKETGK